jgi:large subunit ribosomal protein L21
MYAVIKTGGKQYKVAKDETVTIERLPAEAGSTVEFDQVLAVGAGSGVTLGKPVVAGAKVMASIVKHSRGEKLTVFKKRRRKNSRRKNGHRQDLTVVKITDIVAA